MDIRGVSRNLVDRVQLRYLYPGDVFRFDAGGKLYMATSADGDSYRIQCARLADGKLESFDQDVLVLSVRGEFVEDLTPRDK